MEQYHLDKLMRLPLPELLFTVPDYCLATNLHRNEIEMNSYPKPIQNNFLI